MNSRTNHYSSIDFRRFHVTMFTLITAYIINYVTFLHATIEPEPGNDIHIHIHIYIYIYNSLLPEQFVFLLEIRSRAHLTFLNSLILKLLPFSSPHKDSKRKRNEEDLLRLEIFPDRSVDKVSLSEVDEVRRSCGNRSFGNNTSDRRRRKYAARSALRFGHSRDLSISVVRGRKKKRGGRGGVSLHKRAVSIFFSFFFLFFSFSRIYIYIHIYIYWWYVCKSMYALVCVYPVYYTLNAVSEDIAKWFADIRNGRSV